MRNSRFQHQMKVLNSSARSGLQKCLKHFVTILQTISSEMQRVSQYFLEFIILHPCSSVIAIRFNHSGLDFLG